MNEDMKTVDVVIPLYNNKDYVVQAVQSVLDQTHKVHRIIIIDDGSTDGSAEIVENTYRTNKYVRLIRNGHHERSATRNRGILESTADYIAFLDSDDVWINTKLEKQLQLIGGQTGVVYCGYIEIDESGKDLLSKNIVRPKAAGKVFYSQLFGCTISASSSAVLIKRTLFHQAGVFDETMNYGEDWDMWLRLARITHFRYAKEPLVCIRRHRKQSTARDKSSHIKSLVMFAQLIRIWAKWPKQLRVNYPALQRLTTSAVMLSGKVLIEHGARALPVIHRRVIKPLPMETIAICVMLLPVFSFVQVISKLLRKSNKHPK